MSSEDSVPRLWRTLALAFAVLSLLLGIVVFLKSRELDGIDEVPPQPRVVDLEPALRLSPAEWSDLVGWEGDSLGGFSLAFGRSCRVFAGMDPHRDLGSPVVAGTAEDWRPACEAVEQAADADSLRAVLAERLRPWAVRNRRETEGLFTGYFEPSLQGSRGRDDRYDTPLYRRPPELVNVDLGSFRDDLKGRRVAGRIESRRLVPFADRADLENGALANRGLELVWVDDPIAAFFLHIQGSGRVELPDGSSMRVGYDGQNGHPYTAIGRELVALSELTLEEVSMQSIRAWLDTHPDRAREIMNENRSFVFFRELRGEGPVGSQGVTLTPQRSLAVDRKFLPLGVPLWLDTSVPGQGAEPEGPFRQLVVAQDTGGAIRGPVRGDVFWGRGAEAAEIAGRMRQPGRMWILLPTGVEPAAELLGDGSL